MKLNFNKNDCPNCEATGQAEIWVKKERYSNSLWSAKKKCFLCRGTGQVTEKRLYAQTLLEVERLAAQKKVVLLSRGAWNTVRFWGHYRSDVEKILRETFRYYVIKIQYDEVFFDKKTGWRKGLKTKWGRNGWRDWIAPESLEFLQVSTEK